MKYFFVFLAICLQLETGFTAPQCRDLFAAPSVELETLLKLYSPLLESQPLPHEAQLRMYFLNSRFDVNAFIDVPTSNGTRKISVLEYVLLMDEHLGTNHTSATTTILKVLLQRPDLKLMPTLTKILQTHPDYFKNRQELLLIVLHNKNFDPNYHTEQSDSILMIATRHFYTEFLAHLIHFQSDLNINAINKNGHNILTALLSQSETISAVEKNDYFDLLDITTVLLRRSDLEVSQLGNEAFLRAVERGYFGVARKILAHPLFRTTSSTYISTTVRWTDLSMFIHKSPHKRTHDNQYEQARLAKDIEAFIAKPKDK